MIVNPYAQSKKHLYRKIKYKANCHILIVVTNEEETAVNISTIAEVQKDFRNGVYNKTDNGKCTGCGECCSNILPMTEAEVKIIKDYVRRHSIKEEKIFAPTLNPQYDLTCPFMSKTAKENKCAIYEVRPAICRCFIWSEPRGALKHREMYEEIRVPMDVRDTFFGG